MHLSLGNNILYIVYWRFKMIIDMSRLSKDELIEALNKAMKQISKLVDENKILRDAMRKTIETGDNQYIKGPLRP